MNALARIRHLARQLTCQNASRRNAPKKFDLAAAIRDQDLHTIPSPLWVELDSYLDHKPALGLALVRVLHAIAKRGRNPQIRAQADLALIRALNVCGEFYQATLLSADAARRFEKLGDLSNMARIWLEAAWAEMWLGDLQAVEAYLGQVDTIFSHGDKNSDLELRVQWIRARILSQQGQLKDALAQIEPQYRQLRGTNVLEAARLLREIGLIRARIDPSAGLRLLERARAVFEQALCPTETALCHYCLAQALIDLNRFEEAKNNLVQAQRTFRQQALSFFDALCDLELGFLACELDRFQESLGYTFRARTRFAELRAWQELSSCEVNLGWALMKLNRYAEALPPLKHAAQIALDAGRQAKAAVCFSNIGLVFEKQGHYAQALEYHQRARDIFAREKMLGRLVESDLALGALYAQLGDSGQALTVLARTRRVCQREQMWASLAECELYRAYILLSVRKFVLARGALQAARQLFAKNRQKTSIAFCDRLLARLESRAPRTALAHLASSRQVFHAHKLFVDVALCDMTRAELALEWGEWREAQRALQRAGRVLSPNFPDQAWRIAFGFGKAAQARNDIKKARRYYLDAAYTLAHLRHNLRLEELSNEVFGARRFALDEALAFMEQHRLERDALTLLETAKAQTFVHALAVGGWRASDGAEKQDGALAAKEQALRYELDATRAKLVTLPVAQPSKPTRGGALGLHSAANTLARLGKLERAYERVALQRRLAQPGLTGLPTLEPFNLAALRAAANAQWGRNWSALDYYFGNGHLYRAWITPDALDFSSAAWSSYDQWMLEQCATNHPDLRELVYGRTLRGLPSNGLAHTALEFLAQRLVPTPLLEMKREQTLLVAPHGLLHQLPFHALQVHDRPLLEHFTFLYTPSLQAFTQLTATPKKQKRGGWLLYGVSDFGTRARPLDHTRLELDKLEILAPSRATVCWQGKATRAQLLDWNQTRQLTDFEVLHFATHAVMEPHAPHTSRIMLADQDLTVLDVMELNLKARLVTLSTCSSALGKGGSGDEWLGLTRAFFYAGARSLVASLWAVEDESTSNLMMHFYRNLEKGESIPDALRHSQLELHSMGYSAYHWAPFIVMGTG